MVAIDDWPFVWLPCDFVQQTLAAYINKRFGVISMIQQKIAPGLVAHNAAVPGTNPFRISGENRVVLIFFPRTKKIFRPSDPQGVIASPPTARITGIKQIAPAVAAQHKWTLDKV